MTTPRTRALVSLALALSSALATVGCASAPSRATPDRPAQAEIRFDNEAADQVRVYLVGARRQWLLGRVEPGARATLRIPDAALSPSEGWMRLAVVVGGGVSMRVANDPQASVAIAQPAMDILTQRWSYARSVSTGRLVSLPLSRRCVGSCRE